MWKLIMELKYVKTQPDYTYIECDHVAHRDGFFQYLDDEGCPQCGGRGTIRKPIEYPPKPKVSDELLDHMRNAYAEYLKGQR